MKKRGNRFPKNHSIHKRHHHVKLAALFTSKIIIAIISFTVGIYVGSLTSNTFISLLIAFGLGILLYLMSVLHLIDWLKI
jgi:hypothetical protein